MNIIDAFKVGIGQVEYSDPQELSNKVHEILTDSDINYGWQNPLNANLTHWYSHDSETLESFNNFNLISNWMLDKVSEYAKQMGYNCKLICTEIWINVNKGGIQYFHNHTNSYFSSTLYVDFDQEDHPALTFDRPDGSYKPTLELKADSTNVYNAESFTPNIQSGSMLIWPSQLQHGYYAEDKWLRKKHRVSISANYMPETINNGVYKFKISRD